jgi:hypothetical protein
MLQTIEVEIDAKGHIHPLEKFPLPIQGKSRALLTLLPSQPVLPTRHSVKPASGVLSASCTVSLVEMDSVIRSRGGRL